MLNIILITKHFPAFTWRKRHELLYLTLALGLSSDLYVFVLPINSVTIVTKSYLKSTSQRTSIHSKPDFYMNNVFLSQAERNSDGLLHSPSPQLFGIFNIYKNTLN